MTAGTSIVAAKVPHHFHAEAASAWMRTRCHGRLGIITKFHDKTPAKNAAGTTRGWDRRPRFMNLGGSWPVRVQRTPNTTIAQANASSGT